METSDRPLRSRLSQDQNYSWREEMCFHPLKCDWTFRNTPQITVIMKTMGLIPNFQKVDVSPGEEGLQGSTRILWWPFLWPRAGVRCLLEETVIWGFWNWDADCFLSRETSPVLRRQCCPDSLKNCFYWNVLEGKSWFTKWLCAVCASSVIIRMLKIALFHLVFLFFNLRT